MLVLTMRTDKPEAEVGLYDGQTQRTYQTWQAHRELAETINAKLIDVLLSEDKRLHDLQAILIYKGPGSFTGLRIGMSVANGLAYALNVPVVSEMGDDWIEVGLQRLAAGENERVAMPEYGSEPNITAPKH